MSFLKFVEKYVRLQRRKESDVIITIIIEYAWMCLKKQDSEYASGPKYAKILNMAKFRIWQGSQYPSVTERSEYARICLNRVPNISWVLNMPGFWICKSYTRFQICQNMTEYVWIGRIYSVRSLYKLMSTYWEIVYSEPCQRSKLEK